MLGDNKKLLLMTGDVIMDIKVDVDSFFNMLTTELEIEDKTGCIIEGDGYIAVVMHEDSKVIAKIFPPDKIDKFIEDMKSKIVWKAVSKYSTRLGTLDVLEVDPLVKYTPLSYGMQLLVQGSINVSTGNILDGSVVEGVEVLKGETEFDVDVVCGVISIKSTIGGNNQD